LLENIENNMIEKFYLDKNITFLNHGSFGACPKEVIEKYQYWQVELEKQPVEFLIRKSTQLLEFSRQKLAEFIHTNAENLVFITNTTYGVNSVVNSLGLSTNDEVITSNHEYGACDRTWELASKQKSFFYKKVEIPIENVTILNRFYN
jgi:isopenicillin-N epimerase